VFVTVTAYIDRVMIPVLRACFCFTLLVWLYGLLIKIYRVTNIDYTMLFDINPATALPPYSIMKLASVLTAIFALATCTWYGGFMLILRLIISWSYYARCARVITD